MTKDEAWEMIDSALDHCYSETCVNAIKEALAQPEQPYAHEAAMYSNDRMTVDPQTGNVSIGKQEQGSTTCDKPVALPCCGYTDARAVKWNPFNGVVQCHNCGQTYTTPPQRTWVGLTDEQTTEVIDSMPQGINGWMSDWDLYEFAHAVLAKSKELNT